MVQGDHEVSGGLIERVDASGDGSNLRDCMQPVGEYSLLRPRVDWTALVGSACLRRGWFDRLGAPPYR